jgi:serine/alanine racemase
MMKNGVYAMNNYMVISSDLMGDGISREVDYRRGRSWIEVNLKHLKYNARVLKGLMPVGCDLMAVVKANAYGHGAIHVSRAMNEIGVKSFAVATLSEGIELRNNGILGDILVLGYTDLNQADQLKHYQLTQTIIDYNYALALNNMQLRVPVHLKIDTGMHRLGMDSRDVNKISHIYNLEGIKVKGMYTHLSVADQKGGEAVEYTRGQIEEFYSMVKQLKDMGIAIPKLHVQSSYGLMNYPVLGCDYARMGIALYGSFSRKGDQTGLSVPLKPVLSLKARVALIREVAAGECVSYGREDPLVRNSRIAILPIGYADGLPRSLSFGKGEVLLHGRRASIVGRVCMDQLLIDITDIPEVEQGDIATLIGIDEKDELAASELAEAANSITNELLCRLGSRLERIYL